LSWRIRLAAGILNVTTTTTDALSYENHMPRLPKQLPDVLPKDLQAQIDKLYGLEPVFEPGDATGDEGCSDLFEQYVGVACPYCAEMITVRLDLSSGSQDYIEDCQVCCQAIQFNVQVSYEGGLELIGASRIDR
jgi:hypothetical protein